MDKEYRVKGIEKILEKVNIEELAKYYGVDINSDFEKIISASFQEMGIPNNSEIGIYVALTAEEYDKRLKKRESLKPQDIAFEFYKNDERKRAMYGINYNIAPCQWDSDSNKIIQGTFGNVLYFAVDEPIRESILKNMRVRLRDFVGGCHYNGLLMGKCFYEEHKDELSEYSPSKDEIEAVDKYINNFINEFEDVKFSGGYGPREKYQETDAIKKEKANSEKIILTLTGKNNIDEVSLKDFINLKRRLEKEERELQEAFEERFAGQNDERGN
mgnify:CR=1 FL=1